MDLEDLSKGELIDLVKKLRSKRKYGLVWESEKIRERFDSLSSLPTLELDAKKSITQNLNGTSNVLIEGDNYPALALLNATHTEKVDFIYIDPPYNTGNKDFKYNDDYVERDDAYRHSKWLSFMSKRLELAKELLTEEGVIFISISEIEVGNLILLGNDIFGESNSLGVIPRLTKKGGKTTETFAINHDFVLGWAKNVLAIPKFTVSHDDSKSYTLEDEYVETRGKHNLKQTLDYDSLTYSKSMDYPLEINGTTYYPGGSKEDWQKRQKGNHGKFDWTWRWSEDLVRWGLSEGLIEIKGKSRPRIYTKTYELANYEATKDGWQIIYQDRQKSPSTLSLVSNEFSNDIAKKELNNILGKGSFEFPKPTSLIKYLLSIYPKKDLKVLDFFAGSGTTGDAVLQLNKEDGGSRQFILVTNNEQNICEEVTYPRLKKSIEGFKDSSGKQISGSPADLRYLRVKSIPKTRNPDEMKIRLSEEIVPLLCLKEMIFDEIKVQSNSYHIFESKEKIVGIYNAFDFSELIEFKSKISSYKQSKKKIYMFTFDDEALSNEIFEDMKDISVEPIPQKILEILEGKYV